MAYDYSEDVAFALEMISEHGRLVDFHKLSETPADPDKPLEGVGGSAWVTESEWAAYNHAVNSGSNFAGLNMRIVLDKSLFVPTSKFRLSFDGVVDTVPGTAGTGIAISVGFAATGGNPWDFASAPTQVLFAGQPTFDTVGTVIGEDANRYTSDEIDLVIDGTKDIVVSMTMESGLCGSSMGTLGIPPDTWHMYFNLSPTGTIDELAPADLLDVRALVGDNQQWNLSKIEVLVEAGPVVVSGVYACFVEPSSLRSLGISTSRQGVWKDSTQIALVAPDGVNDLTDFDSITDSDGSTWAVSYADELRPGDTSVLYFIGVKR